MGGLTAVWHDVECAAYTADLALWRELAEVADGPVLDLGCGTGRVALDLAAHGLRVTGLDSEPALVEELRRRARAADLQVEAVVADARSLSLEGEFALVISPMQVVQLLGGRKGRARMLDGVRRHLVRGGIFAAALANPFDGWSDAESLPPLPDVREDDGWIYSSTPVGVRRTHGSFEIERHRQAVSPRGELIEEVSVIALDALTAGELEEEGLAHRYRALARRSVAPTPDYVGSDVVMLEAV